MLYREAAVSYRDVISGDRCKVCNGEPDSRCPGCTAGVCRAHAFSPEGACETCATATLAAGTRAGRQHLVAGLGLLAFAVIAFLYVGATNGGGQPDGTSVDVIPMAERVPWAAGWVCVALAAIGLGIAVLGLAKRRTAHRIAPRQRPLR